MRTDNMRNRIECILHESQFLPQAIKSYVTAEAYLTWRLSPIECATGDYF
jgi:hypothetical protein